MVLLHVFLAVAWVALTGELTTANGIAGVVMGYLVLWGSRNVVGSGPYVRRVSLVLRFILFFVWQLVRSSFRVAYEVVTPEDTMRPGIVAVPLDARTDAEILVLASLITLTPGSLSLDVSPDRRVLYVHEMYVKDPDAAREYIKQGLERRLLEVMR